MSHNLSCRRKKRRAQEDDEDISFPQLLRKQPLREKTPLDIDNEAHPFTAGFPVSQTPRSGGSSRSPEPSSGSLFHHHLDARGDASAPMLRTPIPSPMLPLHDLHGGSAHSYAGSQVRADAARPPPGAAAASSPHDPRDIRRAVLHVTNRLSDGSPPPPVPSKGFLHHAHAKRPVVAAYPVWLPPGAMPSAGPSTMRMPEPPTEPNRPFVPRDLGAARPGPSSVPMSKADEVAADNVHSADPPPPAYSE